MIGWFKDDEAVLVRKMKLVGEHHAAVMLVEHYRILAEGIDPHTDWNGYAAARNNQEQWEIERDALAAKL